MKTITFIVMDATGDSPRVRTVDDPAVLAEIEEEFHELMRDGRVAFADGEKVDKLPAKLPDEVLFLAPMVGG